MNPESIWILLGVLFLGGAIVPGVQVSNEALSSATARLPQVELHPPKSVVGKNTVEAIQSGLVFGAAAETDGIVERMKAELSDSATVVATGGLAPVVVPSCRSVDHHDEWLTLEGLRLVFERNVGPPGELEGGVRAEAHQPGRGGERTPRQPDE